MSKQKIKIMDKRLEVSEEEIRSHMNFDEVLARRNTIANGLGNNFLKWSVPVVAIIAVMVWQLMSKSAPEKIESGLEPVAGQVPASPKKSDSGVAPADVKRDTSTKQPTEKRPRQIPVPKETLPSEAVTSRLRTLEMDSHALKTEFKAYSPAEPVHGEEHLYQYFNDNLRYPQEALKDSIEGVLNVNFVINEEGKPEQISFANSFGASFEQEAIRVIESMPSWKPALLNGRPVKSKVSLPLTFKYQRRKVNESLLEKKHN